MLNLIRSMKDWASNQFGLVIHEDQIKSRVQSIMDSQGLSEEDYIMGLQANRHEVVMATVDAFTVQESYFFRDSSLFLYLKNTLLPQIITRKQTEGDFTITIWSAGCAWGEEIYSIAIYLDQLISDIKKWKINLIATDICENALCIKRSNS